MAARARAGAAKSDAPATQPLPEFAYFPDPMTEGSIVAKAAVCPCCDRKRAFMYVGPIHARAEVTEICPWCLHDGSAAAKWSATFNDALSVAKTVPREIVETIRTRTPGFQSWQGNRWLFSDRDALVFRGEVDGAALLQSGAQDRIAACRAALAEWNFPADFDLSTLARGGQPAVFLFQDRQSGAMRAYADMS